MKKVKCRCGRENEIKKDTALHFCSCGKLVYEKEEEDERGKKLN